MAKAQFSLFELVHAGYAGPLATTNIEQHVTAAPKNLFASFATTHSPWMSWLNTTSHFTGCIGREIGIDFA
jgi:hypothetical protein